MEGRCGVEESRQILLSIPHILESEDGGPRLFESAPPSEEWVCWIYHFKSALSLISITHKIPWKHLGTEPTRVYMEDVFVIACPKSELRFDEEKVQQRKREQLSVRLCFPSHR